MKTYNQFIKENLDLPGYGRDATEAETIEQKVQSMMKMPFPEARAKYQADKEAIDSYIETSDDRDERFNTSLWSMSDEKAEYRLSYDLYVFNASVEEVIDTNNGRKFVFEIEPRIEDTLTLNGHMKMNMMKMKANFSDMVSTYGLWVKKGEQPNITPNNTEIIKL